MNGRDFSIEDALSVGWNLFKANWMLLIGVAIVVAIVAGIPQAIGQAAQGNREPGLFQYLMSLLGALLQTVFSLGVVHIALKLVSGQSAEFGDLFGRMSVLVNYILAAIVFSVAVTVGLVLCIVPGIYLAIRWGLFTYFIVDDGLGPIEALQRSWATTNGATLKLFLLGLVFFLINLVGFLACFVGVLVSYPVTYLAGARVYRQLREQAGFGPPALA